MKKYDTELVFLLDQSGSMYGLTKDTIGGFNSMLEKQKKEQGGALVSTVLFNTTSQVIHNRTPMERVRPMTEQDYRAGGSTALLDAIGGAIHHIGLAHQYARRRDVPARTLFIIMTDGMENASHIYDSETVKRMISRQKEKRGWEFLFFGANIDAVETAASFGIGADRAVDYLSDALGTERNFATVSSVVTSVRSARPISTSWKSGIEADYAARSGQR